MDRHRNRKLEVMTMTKRLPIGWAITVRSRIAYLVSETPGQSACQMTKTMNEKKATISSELCKMATAGLLRREIKRGPAPLRVSWRYYLPKGYHL